jgi:hypothetical protein
VCVAIPKLQSFSELLHSAHCRSKAPNVSIVRSTRCHRLLFALRASAMPSLSPRRPATLWTVVTQGSNLTYDDANLLDKLEFIVGHEAEHNALASIFAQEDFLSRVSVCFPFTASRTPSVPLSFCSFLHSPLSRRYRPGSLPSAPYVT